MRRGKLVSLTGLAAAVVLMFTSITANAAEDSVYTTQRGDNLSRIAQKVYGDRARWKDIYDANKNVIKDPNIIWANQQLVIPGGIVENPAPIPQDTPDIWPETTEQWKTAATLNQNYAEQNGLPFYQGTTYKTLGYRYDKDNPVDAELIEVNGIIRDITIRDAEKEGYQIVTISVSSNGHTAEYWGGEYRYLNYVIFPGQSLCDIYTGRILPNASTDGDVELVNSTDLFWGGISYSVDYIKAVSWDWGEWIEAEGTNSAHQMGTCNVTLTVTIPKGYDGLALQINPSNGEVEDIEYNVFDNTKEEYILDTWKEGSYLIRVSDLYNILNSH